MICCPSFVICLFQMVYLLVADLDKEDGSFHTDGTTDVHLGFDRDELQKMVENTGFGNVTFIDCL